MNARVRGTYHLSDIRIREHMALTILAAAFEGATGEVRPEQIPEAVKGAVRVADLLLEELERPV